MAELAVVTIRRQVLEVDLHGSEAEGHALQRRLPAVCADVLSPAIEQALGHIDPGEGYLYLDRLAIDLTVASLDGLEAELAAAVRREIADHFRRHPPPPLGASGWVGEPGESGWAGDPGAGLPQTAAQRVAEALVTFLRTGGLPWAFRVLPGQTLERLVLEAWSNTGGRRDPPPAIRELLVAVLAVPAARERLVIQFTPGFAIAVLRSLSPDLASQVERVEVALVGSSPASTAARTFTRQVRLIALEAAALGRRPSPSVLVASAWTAARPATRADRTLAAAVEREWPGSTRPATGSGAVATAEPAPAPPATPEGAGPEAGGLLVDCAGLVLLHPFLPRFFEGLGVAAGKALVDPGRALCLLHHLATGELTAPEHRLTLAKALCGVPLDQPVEADVGLTDAETAEATGLLEAAIGHWEALRSTSPDGLRTEFLQRPGVLSVTADGDWLLRVEARTVDILLDQLPWGISPVWLPWMNRLLMVEWR